MRAVAVTREQYQTLMQASKTVRRTEPRATIFDHLAKPFLDSGDEMWAAGVDETTGRAIPITWSVMAQDTADTNDDGTPNDHKLVQVTEMVQDKAEKIGDAGISNIIALINRQDWGIKAEKVTDRESGEVGFVLKNPKVAEANFKASQAAKAEAEADNPTPKATDNKATDKAAA